MGYFLRLCMASLLGVMSVATLAPWHFWYLVWVVPAIFFLLIHKQGIGRATLLGWAYGLSFFGFGIGWVYNSVFVYGNLDEFRSKIVVGLLVAGLALFYAALAMANSLLAAFQDFLTSAREDDIYLDAPETLQAWSILLRFAGLWCLFEWLRSWLFTGLPWLETGLALTASPFTSLFPVVGLPGITALVAIGGICLALLALRLRSKSAVVVEILLILLLPVSAWYLASEDRQWTQSTGSANASVVYADIDLYEKWGEGGLRKSLAQLQPASDDEADIILWPEAALPTISASVEELDELQETLRLYSESDSSLVAGYVRLDEQGQQYNSLRVWTNGEGKYDKEHLVPFGEYVPLKSQLQELLAFFNVAFSELTAGTTGQPLMTIANGMRLGAAICYEIAFRDELIERNKDADVLVSVSNMTWFGDSNATVQMLQMAQGRALEMGRWVLHSTNGARSAIISPSGQIHSAMDKTVKSGSVDTSIEGRSGITPAMRVKGWHPAAILLYPYLLTLLVLAMQFRPRLKKTTDQQDD